MHVLVVAEKPSMALSIAGFLALEGTFTTRTDGVTPVHELQHRFQGRHACFRVTSVKGHVFNLDFEAKYNSWDCAPRSLFSAGTVKVPSNGALVSHIRQEATGCEHLLLFLDCDREGENICFEVMHVALPVLKRGPPGERRVHRAFFSAVSASSIAAAMASLREPNEHEASAVDARQELDLKVGVAFTRFLTQHANDHFKRLGASTVSFGPCQTPTLGFVVRRYLESQDFEPEPNWTIGLTLAGDALATEAGASAVGGIERRVDITDGNAYTEAEFQEEYGGLVEWNMAKPPPAMPRKPSSSACASLAVHWERGCIYDRGVAHACLQLVRAGGCARLVSLAEKVESKARPLGLNTVTMLKVCSRALGIGAEKAMRIAEALYLAGYLSYPRTESTGYPTGFDYKTPVAAQVAASEWGEYAAMLLQPGSMDTSRRGVDQGDHPPITPVCAATRESVSSCGGSDAWRLYSLVAKTFLASLGSDATLRCLRAEFVAGGERFSATGKELVHEGWLAVMPHLAPETHPLPPWLVAMQADAPDQLAMAHERTPLRFVQLDLIEGTTTAPGPISESELISDMERHGIGTDASIPSHIGTIEARRYVRVVGHRQFEPTALGLAIIRGIERIDPELVLPTVRSHVEAQLEIIAKGAAMRADVVRHVLREFEDKFAFFAKHVGRLTEVLRQSFGVPGNAIHAIPAKGGGGGVRNEDTDHGALAGESGRFPGKTFCRAPRSGHYLHLVADPTPHLVDLRSQQTWALPVGGRVKPFYERRCPLCEFELLLYTPNGRGPPRSYPLCPGCYQKEARAEESPGRCSACPHPESHPTVTELLCCACPETADQGGMLLLDPTGGPNWRLVSTRGSYSISLPAFIQSITISGPCGCALTCRKLRIQFDRNWSPLDHGDTVHEGCPVSDPLIQALCDSASPVMGGRGKNGRNTGAGKGKGKGKGAGRPRGP